MTEVTTKRPGRMSAEHFLTIETRMGQQMYHGRDRSKDKEYITGFNRFGSLMTGLYLRASQDDPYFDYWLIVIEDKMKESMLELESIKKQLEELLASNDKLQINVPHSVSPIKVALTFRNPYAFRAADLIIAFDDICKLLNAGRHTARLTTSQFHALRQRASKAVRSLFEKPLSYPTKGMIVSREEYRQNTQKAQAAKKKYGSLDDDIIEGKKRGEFAPNIKSSVIMTPPKRKKIQIKTAD